MRRSLARVLLAVLTAGVAFPASARWYQVEVIVFEHTGGAASGNEQWPELAEMPDFSQAMELLTDIPAMADEPPPAGAANEPVAFVPLARGDMRLAGVAQRLSGARGYHPLFATAWRQPSFGVAGAKRVYLSDLGGSRSGRIGITADTAGILSPKAEGTVSIKVDRLLHIVVDFLYYHESLPVRLQETRGAKLREIHYFDHPLFGVIVQVSPFVLPDVPATAEVAADEPLDESEITAPPLAAPGAPVTPAPIPQAPPAPAPRVR